MDTLRKHECVRTMILLTCVLSLGTLVGCRSSNVKKAEEHMAAGMYQEAIPLLEREINQNPDNAQAHFMLGNCKLAMRETTEAKKCFDRAKRVDPGLGKEVDRALVRCEVAEENVAKDTQETGVCWSNLNGIGKVICLYCTENKDKFPSDLNKLINYGGLISQKMLVCPSTGSMPPACDYVYLAPKPNASFDTTFIYACDKTGNHSAGRNVLISNMTVVWMTEVDFQAELAKPQNAAFAAALAKVPPTVRKGG